VYFLSFMLTYKTLNIPGKTELP